MCFLWPGKAGANPHAHSSTLLNTAQMLGCASRQRVHCLKSKARASSHACALCVTATVTHINPTVSHSHHTDAGLCKPAADTLLEVQGLVLAVMYEKALGPKSRWGPYLAFLPDSMDHMPVYWTVSGFCARVRLPKGFSQIAQGRWVPLGPRAAGGSCASQRFAGSSTSPFNT